MQPPNSAVAHASLSEKLVGKSRSRTVGVGSYSYGYGYFEGYDNCACFLAIKVNLI